jgi:hypothetical protein
LRLHVEMPTARLVAAMVDGEHMVLRVAAPAVDPGAKLVLTGSSERTLRAPVVAVDEDWEATVPLSDLTAGLAEPTTLHTCRRADAVHWTMTLVGASGRHRVWHDGTDEVVWSDGLREVALAVNGAGLSTLVDRRRAPVLSAAGVTDAGVALHVSVPDGVVPTGYAAAGGAGVLRDLVATSDGRSVEVVVPADDGWVGTWRLCWGDPHGPTTATYLAVAGGGFERPVTGTVGGFAVACGVDRAGAPVVTIRR